jgi:hypothetical protein
MSGGLSRWSAIAGLLLAILNDLRRRAWWAYRRGGVADPTPRVTIVARREAQQRPYPPQLTAAWRPLAERALPVAAAGLAILERSDVLPAAWIDAADRLDIRDLPRVLRSEGASAQVATQWLHDPATHAVLLVVTYVDPAISSWALRWERDRHAEALERIVAAGRLMIVLESPPPPNAHGAVVAAWEEPPPDAIDLPIATIDQLAAILEHGRESRPRSVLP